jgi:hypothetical protein
MKIRAILSIFAAAIAAAVVLAPPVQSQSGFGVGVTTSGLSSHLRVPPTYVDVRVLAAGVSETHTLPTGPGFVIFSPNCATFYAKIGASAAVPAADVTDGTGSELNPSGYLFGKGVTQITLISPGACIVTLSFYAAQ